MKTPPGSPVVARDEEREWRLEVWVRRYTAMVYSLALRMTGDGGWAEELTQDVFLELDRNQARMQSEEHIRRWLRQVVMHRAVDGMRRRNSREPGWREGRWMGLNEAGLGEAGLGEARRRGMGLGAMEMAGTGWGQLQAGASEHAGVSIRVSARVERWLLALPQRQRQAVLLRYQEAMTPEEIAAALRAPLATVKSHLQRGLKTLRGVAEKEMSDGKR